MGRKPAKKVIFRELTIWQTRAERAEVVGVFVLDAQPNTRCPQVETDRVAPQSYDTGPRHTSRFMVGGSPSLTLNG